jgi:hypothetical protein
MSHGLWVGKFPTRLAENKKPIIERGEVDEKDNHSA